MTRCGTCGSRRTRHIEDWCPVCGAALFPDPCGWELGAQCCNTHGGSLGRPFGRYQPQATRRFSSEVPPRTQGSLLRVVSPLQKALTRKEASRRNGIFPSIAPTRPRGYHGRLGHHRFSTAWIVATVLLLMGIGAATYVFVEDAGQEVAGERGTTAPVSADTARFLTYDAVSGLFGYADGTGTMVIEPRFMRAGQFLEGLAPVQIEADAGKAAYGYIDTSGAVVIEPRFKTAAAFCQGLARVEMTVDGDDRYGFIDRTGAMIIEPQYVAAWDFSEGMARVTAINDSGLAGYGFVDRAGKMVIEPRFKSARDFSQGLAAVAADDAWGYIDRTGAWVIEPHFTYAMSFLASGLAAVDLEASETVRREGSPGTEGLGLHQAYINKRGEIVWQQTQH